MSVEASNPPTSKSPKGPESSSSDALRAEFTATNYGSQVAYNYGSISNYFCHDSDDTHQCSFPKVSLPKDSPESQLYNKIERARILYKSRRWTEAKVLFYEVLHTHYPTPAATERLLIQYNLAHAHFALAEFSEAVCHFQELVDIREERNETPEESISDSRYWLARSFYHLKRYEDASTELQVFVLTHDQQDSHSAEQATTGRLWLGLTFERLEQHEEAKEQLKMAFETRSQTLGSEHLDTLACQHHLANFLYKRKAFLEAQEQFDALLHAENRLSGAEKSEAVKTRCMLAFCLAKLERYDDAEPHLERVLARMDSYSRRTAEEVRDTGLICYWLGCIALRKDSVKAGRLFQRALNCIPNAAANSKNDNNDLQDELIDCRRRLACTMHHQGQFAGAEQTFRHVIDDMDETKQDDLIASRYGLASSLIAQKKFTEAKSTLEEVPTIMSPIKNCRHTGEDLAACVHRLGVACWELNQYREARDCFQRVVDIVPETPNQNHSASQQCLAMALFELQEFESARKHFQERYDTVTKHFPSRRQFATATRFWLAWSLCELGHFNEAEPHLQPTFTMFPKPEKGPIPESDFVLGRSHYYMGRIVLCQKDRKDPKEAAKHFRIALPMLNRRFGPDDPTYLQCRYHLAYSLFELDENSEARQIFEELLNNESQHNIVQDVRLILAPYWLGRISNLQRKPQDSEQYFAKCLNALGSKTLPLHPTISTEKIQYDYAFGLYRNNQMEECAEIVRKILAHAHQLDLNAGSELYLLSRWLLSRCLYFAEKYDEACEHLKLTVTAYEATYGYGNLQTSLARAYLVDSLCERKRYIEADPVLINVATQQGASPGTKEELVKAIGTYWLGRRTYDRAKWKEAEDCFDTAWTLLAASSRDKTWDRLRFGCRHFLARIKLKNKQLAEAENLFRELARQQYKFGDINYAVDNQYYLGFSLRLQRKYDSARSVLQKILDDNKEGRFIDHGIPLCHYQVGHCLYRVHKIKEAKSQLEIALECPHQFSEKFQARLLLGQSNYQLSLFEESRADFQSLLEEGHKDSESVFLCRFWLGKTHFELKNWGDASTHLLIAHESGKKGWSNVLDSQYFLARAQFEAANYTAALGHFKSICDKQKDNVSSMISDSHYYLGLTLFELGQFKLSRETLLVARARQEKRKNSKMLELILIRYQLARCDVKLGIFTTAQSEFEGVLPFFESRSASGDQTIVHIQYELAFIAYRHRNWKRALEFFQEALLNHETVHVNSSLDVLQCQQYLAATLRELQRYDEALQLYQQVLEKRKETLQAPHQTVVDVQIGLCETLCWLGKFAEASTLTQEALKWQEQLSGTDHASCCAIRLILAKLAYNQLDFHLAAGLYSKALAQLESSDQAQKAVHHPLASSYATLALALSKLGQADEAKQQAVKALQRDRSEGRQDCQGLDGFVGAFGELLHQEATTSCQQLPSSADEKSTTPA